jgi:hypothetical protein
VYRTCLLWVHRGHTFLSNGIICPMELTNLLELAINSCYYYFLIITVWVIGKKGFEVFNNLSTIIDPPKDFPLFHDRSCSEFLFPTEARSAPPQGSELGRSLKGSCPCASISVVSFGFPLDLPIPFAAFFRNPSRSCTVGRQRNSPVMSRM